MRLIIDTDLKIITQEKDGLSKESFELLSTQWLKVGCIAEKKLSHK